MSSFSQNGEDTIVAGFFGDTLGRLLEIGSWVPTSLSNSRLFIQRGWNATLVEFSPGPMRALVGEYGTFPNVRIVQAAITASENSLGQFDISDDGLSTAEPANFAKWKAHGGFFGKLWVPQIPISVFLSKFGGGYDFVSIDTEGTSIPLAIALLRDCGERPRVLCVEHDGHTDELYLVAQKYGYGLVHENSENVILAK